MHKSLLPIAVIALMLVSCQQEMDDYSALSGALGNAAVENRTAERLFRLMERQDGSYKRLQQSLGTGTPDFAHTETGATADYGTFYLIPYTDAEGVISGAIIYPTDEQNTDLETRSLDGMLGTPVNITPEYLNTDIPITSRLLYSNRFLVWSDNGLTVSPRLYQFALKLSEGDVPITDEERRAADERVLTPRTRMTYMPGYVYVNATFDLYSYDWVKEDLGASAVALSKQTLESIIHDAFRQYTSRLHAALVETVFPTYHALTLALKVTDDALYESGTFGDVLRDVFEEVRYQVYWKGFNITFNYWFDIAPRDSTGTTSGGGGSGSQTGGTTGSVGTGDGEEPDVKQFVNDCDFIGARYKDSVKTIVSRLYADVNPVIASYGDSYQTFLDTVANAKNEYSILLNEYREVSPSGFETVNYGFNHITGGTQTNVSNKVSQITVAAIHNHPNSSAPSFLDLSFIAGYAADPEFTKFQSLLVYDAASSSYYALYIHDHEKAAKFFDIIKNEVDSTRNDYKKGGKIDLFLASKEVPRGVEGLMYQLTAVLNNYDSGISLHHIDNDGNVGSFDVKDVYDEKGNLKDGYIYIICK